VGFWIGWHQIAKRHWIQEGDRNGKFFPKVASSRRKYNAIRNIKVNGELHA